MPYQPTAGPPDLGAQHSRTPRIQLKPEVPTASYVDGGWWPRSTNLVVELPPLLAWFAPTLGHAALVGYHLNAWDIAPGHIDIGNDMVLLQGFTADDPHSIVIVSHSGQRRTLLVVTPEATDLEAQQALSRAAEPSEGTDSNIDAEKASDRSLDEVAGRLSLLAGITDDIHRATVRRWVNEAAEQFDHAPIQGYVPILVEHIVRGQIATAALRE